MSNKRVVIVFQYIIIGLILVVSSLSVGVQWGISWSGSWNSLNEDGTFEAQKINITEVYWNSENRTDVLAYPEQAASYIIFKSGSNYYAKNGTTGQIDYSGSDFTTFMQNVIDVLTNGGTIYVKNGVYTFTDRITLDSDITIIGESWNTIFDFPNNFVKSEGILIFKDEDIELKRLYFRGPNNASYQPFRPLTINGHQGARPYKGEIRLSQLKITDFIHSSSGSGLYIQKTDYPVWIEGNYFDNVRQNIVLIDYGSNVYVLNNFFKDYTVQGIGVEPGSDVLIENVHITDNIFISNASVYNQEAINIICNTQQEKIHITNNIIDCEYKGSGIQVTKGNHITINENTIINANMSNSWGIKTRGCQELRCLENKVYNSYYGIKEEDYSGTTSDHNLFSNNQLRNCSIPMSIVSGNSSKIFNNLGFETENCGIETCADNENIAHGLAGIPTYIEVTPMNDTYDSIPVIATVDWSNVNSTSIQVGLYWINGTAISDDVILVAWKVEYEP